MAQIDGIIPEQNFELCRDRIAEILTLELANQSMMYSPAYPLLHANVWVERFIPFEEKELPAINIGLVQDNFESKDKSSALGNVLYAIEVWVKAASSDGTRGDVHGRKEVQRLMGIIRYILEYPAYRRLGFDPPSLSGTSVGALKIPDRIQEVPGMNNMTLGMVEFNVKVTENVLLKTPVQLRNALTVVKINETDKGYRYEYVAP